MFSVAAFDTVLALSLQRSIMAAFTKHFTLYKYHQSVKMVNLALEICRHWMCTVNLDTGNNLTNSFYVVKTTLILIGV